MKLPVLSTCFPVVCVLIALGAGAPASAHPRGDGAAASSGHGNQPQVEKVNVAHSTITPLEIRGNHPVIQVTIGDKGPYPFIVDTGASHCVIDSSLAAELGLQSLGEVRMGDPSNPNAIQAEQVKIPSLRIGDATFEGVFAASWNQSKMFHGEDPPRGVIGLPMFKDVLVTFDYAGKKFEVAPGSLPKADGKSIVPFVTPDGVVQFSLTVGGVKTDAHLDTGSSGFFSVPKDLREKLKFAGPLVEVGRARTVNSEFTIMGGTLDGTLEFAGNTYDHPFIETSDVLPMPNLGGKALAPFAITFDQRAGVMRFALKGPLVSPSAPKAAVQNASAGGGAPAGPSTGIRFAMADGLSVYDVAPGSAGEKAGITAGEQVLKINGKDVEAYDDDSRRAALRTSPVTLTLRKDGQTRDVTITF